MPATIIVIVTIFLCEYVLISNGYRFIQPKQRNFHYHSTSTESNFVDDNVDCLSEGGQTGWVQQPLPVQDAFVTPPPREMNDLTASVQTTFNLVSQFGFLDATAENIVKISDAIDQSKESGDRVNAGLLRLRRKIMLSDILRSDRNAYLSTAQFMLNRIPREDFPNLQNLPVISKFAVSQSSFAVGEEALIDNCELPNMEYNESPLDKLLLGIFRGLVQKEIGYKSGLSGIKGLLDEGRYYKLSEEGQANDSKNQHKFVKNVLGGLLTPFLPPFYRIFMAGIIPCKENGDPDWLVSATNSVLEAIPTDWSVKQQLVPGKQLGPWFYAPLLTSAVTPPFLAFLLGPCQVNFRKDGQLGGMVAQKCKFLQVCIGCVVLLFIPIIHIDI